MSENPPSAADIVRDRNMLAMWLWSVFDPDEREPVNIYIAVAGEHIPAREAPEAGLVAGRFDPVHGGFSGELALTELGREVFVLFRDAIVNASIPKPRACRVCGCTEDKACVTAETPKTRLGCHWVEPDLCSACAEKSQP